MPDNDRAPRLCVLIDADNVPHAHAEAIFEEISGLGEASVRRIYGDWSAQRLNGWAKKANSLGLVADQQFANTKGKNASDIALVIAAMDFLLSGRFDGFVLVSSDSDFTRLAQRIREQGLDVFGIGEKKTPEAFRNACKRFIYVENLGNDSAPKTILHAPADTPPTDRTPPAKLPPKDAIPLIVAAMKRIGLEEEWYSLGQLGQFIIQANADFDTRTYGSAKLSDLLRDTGRFEVKKSDTNHLIVRDLA
ncbi:NYN domain-containing protein [Thioclava sp. SK-1]|uniref:NYN domain-containing protein n=1 Tax=Thioclava sp. SK-1 TaxID=1889770 RepID=UPI000A5F3C61|nr:NYN domain-containing protein [Thioclava sp. SK-1]